MTTDTRGAGAATDGRLVGVGLRRFDPLLNGIVGAFGVLYTLQTADSFVADLPMMSTVLGGVVIALVVASVLAGLGPIVRPGLARPAFLTGAALYAVALLLWPLAIRPPIPTDPMPWLVAVWPAPAAYFALAVRSRVVPIVLATLLSVVATAVLQLVGGLGTADACINGVFMTLTAAVLVLLLGAVRSGVLAAARAQQAALTGFASAQHDDATEDERKRTDALMHDAVLTTFLAASAARTPEAEELARRMAANSLRVLMHVNGVGREGVAVVPLGRAFADEHDQLAPLLAGFESDLDAIDAIVLPEDVAHAVVTVTVEVLRNSVQHAAGATRRSIRVHPLGPDGVRVTVEDDGCGFDVAAVGRDGTGFGRKVVHRLRGLEGRVDVRSAAGEGTSVTMSWGSVVMSGTALPTGELTVSS